MEIKDGRSLMPALFSLGFGYAPIAQALQLPQNVVQSDFIALRKSKAYPARPITHHDALQAAWLRYLQLSPTMVELRHALALLLSITVDRHGISPAAHYFILLARKCSVPQLEDPAEQGYVDYLLAKRRPIPDLSWSKFLLDCKVQHHHIDFRKDTVLDVYAEWVASRMQGSMFLRWPKGAIKKRLARVFREETEPMLRILTLRCEGVTRPEIISAVKLTGAVVDRLEKKALEVVRKSKYAPLRALLDPVKSA